ncbi:MAG TPA: ParA family protein [Rubricoccaceae bacterium]|nr:ParA family protein [Rubricoccaceae bacterium]
MALVTICNHKGGTGKTTSVIHLAAAFGLSGRRVLVVDLDPQGFLTRMLGVDEPEVAASSLALFGQEVDFRTLPTLPMRGFELLPASSNMTRALRQLNRPTDVFWMKEALAAGYDHDLVLFDTAAAVSVFTMNALVASDFVLIPVTPEYQPVVGAEQTWGTVGLVKEKLNPGLQGAHFLLTQVDARKRDHAAYARYLHERYGDHILRAIIRTHATLAEANRDGTTVFDRDVTARGARDYANAADELLAIYFPDAERGDIAGGTRAPVGEPAATATSPPSPIGAASAASTAWVSLDRV